MSGYNTPKYTSLYGSKQVCNKLTVVTMLIHENSRTSVLFVHYTRLTVENTKVWKWKILFANASELHLVYSGKFGHNYVHHWKAAGILHYFIQHYSCIEPIPPSRGSTDNFQSAAEGATITYSCSPGLVPRTQMSAVCTNMAWRPDPATLQCKEPGV